MIRINLLGQTRPKASRRPTMAVDTGGAMPVAFIGVGAAVGLLVLGFFYYTWQRQLTDENNKIKTLQAQKTELMQTKQQVEAFEKQKAVLQQRVNTIEQLQRAIAAYPRFMLLFNELGVQYLRLGDSEKANKALESALKLAPTAFTPLLNHGIVLVSLNRYKEAESELRAAIKQNPESAFAHYFLGRTLARLRRFNEAEGYLTRAIQLSGDDVNEAHRYLGAIYNDRGDDRRAISELETYLRLVPSAKDAQQIREIIQQLKESSRAAKRGSR